MADKTGYKWQGEIDLTDFTTTAYLPANGVIVLNNAFSNTGKSLLQMGSDDLSGAVTCTLEVSVDGDYWGAAQQDGADITFSLSATTPVVEILEGSKDLLFRVSIAIAGVTGSIKYKIKDTK